jgi:hypothetical protein
LTLARLPATVWFKGAQVRGGGSTFTLQVPVNAPSLLATFMAKVPGLAKVMRALLELPSKSTRPEVFQV